MGHYLGQGKTKEAAWKAASGTAATYAVYAAAQKANQKQTADICRKYLPIEIWNVNKLLNN